VVWRYARGQGKDKKVPYNPHTGKHANTTDPATWGTFYEALEAYEAGGYAGIGLVFSEDDPYAGADFDHCRNPETGEIAGWVLEWVEALDGYCEVSPSGTGVHVIVRGTAPNRHNRKAGVEAYSKERFFTFTGTAY
jgi:primase-polymerase (primpol)-like protein